MPPKVSLLLELKNMIKPGLKSAKQDVDTGVSEMKAKMNDLKVSGKDVAREIGKGSIRPLTRDVTTNVASIKQQFGELKNSGTGALEAIAGQVPGAGQAISMLRSPLTAIIALITTFLASGYKAAGMAYDWEKGMAKVNVTAQLQKQELKDLSQTIRGIGERNTAPLNDVPEAFNKIISAGLDVNTSLKLLEPTLKAAKAGFTDLETTGKAAVSVMASSGIKDATRIYDILFATVNKGNAEFRDIAQYLPKIIPMARQAGFSLEDAAGAYAYLTAQGHNAMEASTELLNTFKVFSQSRFIYGDGQYKGFKGLGVQIFDATGKARTLKDIIGQLTNVLDGLTDEQRVKKLSTLGLDVESSMSLAAMTQDYKKFGDILDFVQNSQGQFAESVKNSETSLDNWKVLTNQIKGDMSELGEQILPTVSKITGEALEKYKDLKATIKDIGNDSTLFKTTWENIDNVFKGLDLVVDNVKEAFKKALDLVQPAIDFFENVARFSKDGFGFESVQTERKRKQDQQVWEKTWSWRKDFTGDPAIVAQAQMQAMRNFAQNPSGDIQGAREDSYITMRRLTYQQKAFDNALDELQKSKDKMALKMLKTLNITGPDSFYSLMQSGSLNNALGMMQNLMPQIVHHKGGKTTSSTGNSDIQGTASGSQQTRNITINFDSYIKGDVVSQNKVIQNMSKEDLMQFLQENFNRLLFGIETSYGS